ncbi:hypothetical protein SDC9_70696 [bioreactor metagenome]|uniref:Uncharacterized protein n=1 Tax=bioreactor metagenome TaxID=1076179 RepID=A0A644Y6M7_9ZZZZ
MRRKNLLDRPAEARQHHANEQRHHPLQNRVFIWKVAKNCSFRNARAFGDLFCPRCFKPLLGEDVDRCIDDSYFFVRRVLRIILQKILNIVMVSFHSISLLNTVMNLTGNE